MKKKQGLESEGSVSTSARDGETSAEAERFGGTSNADKPSEKKKRGKTDSAEQAEDSSAQGKRTDGGKGEVSDAKRADGGKGEVPDAKRADGGKGEIPDAKRADGGKGEVPDAKRADGGKEGTPDAKRQKKNGKYNYLIQNRNVRKQARKRNVALFMIAFIAVTVVLGAIVYGVSLMIQHNNLKILIDKPGANVLSLSATAEFGVGTEVLALGGPRYMDNVSLVNFYSRVAEIRATDGAYRPDDSKFLAATFYLKNVTDRPQFYSEVVVLSEVTQNLDSAMRVMLVKEQNGEVSEEVYAKANAAEGGTAYDETAIPEEVCPGQRFGRNGTFVSSEEDVWMAKPFVSPQYAFYDNDNKAEPGEVVKYTVIVWLEGWDGDCVDARLGGTIRLELQFIQS